MSASQVLVLALSVFTATTTAIARERRPSTLPSLAQAAGDRMLMGAAVWGRELDDPKLTALITGQFNSITACNEFKPESLQREKGTFTFQESDKVADFAQRNGLKMIGHTLVWHFQSPRWMFQDADRRPLSRDVALTNLKEHMDTVVKHFEGKVIGWDVVNEAISDKDDEYLRDTPARRAIGDDFVIQAFKIAHAANPTVELYYNDFNIDAPRKRAKAIRLIKELKAAGCRVDAVGIQGHWLLGAPDVAQIDDGITQLAEQGVKVMITELDVDVLPRRGAGADVSATEKQGSDPYRDGLPVDVQEKQAQRYREIFRVLAKHRDAGVLTRVTFWGVYDGNTWLDDWPVRGRTNHPLLWDRQLRPKPALNGVIGALQR